jgi:hypothetical protein
MTQPLAAGLVVALVSLAAILGPALGLSPWLITGVVAVGMGGLTLDAARFGGRGGHVLAEALPGGQARLRRIAIHEAGHILVARQELMLFVRVQKLHCLRLRLFSLYKSNWRLSPMNRCTPILRIRWSVY